MLDSSSVAGTDSRFQLGGVGSGAAVVVVEEGADKSFVAGEADKMRKLAAGGVGKLIAEGVGRLVAGEAHMSPGEEFGR